MKLIISKNINKTNAIMEKLNENQSDVNVEIEVYSCKKTKFHKKNRDVKKPLKFLIAALDESFPNYEFSHISLNEFIKSNSIEFFENLKFVFLKAYKNETDSNDTIKYWEMLINSYSPLKASIIYKYYIIEEENTVVYLIYNSKLKRVILIKILHNK